MFVISAFAFSLTGPAAATTGSHVMGAKYAYVYGLYAQLLVTDPEVEGTFATNFYVSSLVASSDNFTSPGHFIQVGWAEVGWEAPNQQRLFIQYRGPFGPSSWIFRPDIPIRPGRWLILTLDCCRYFNGQPHWGAWILLCEFGPCGWYQLAMVPLGFEDATVVIQAGEVSTQGFHFALPRTPFLNARICARPKGNPMCPFNDALWDWWSFALFPQTAVYPPPTRLMKASGPRPTMKASCADSFNLRRCTMLLSILAAMLLLVPRLAGAEPLVTDAGEVIPLCDPEALAQIRSMPQGVESPDRYLGIPPTTGAPGVLKCRLPDVEQPAARLDVTVPEQAITSKHVTEEECRVLRLKDEDCPPRWPAWLKRQHGIPE